MTMAKWWPERWWSSLPSNTFWGSSECKSHNSTCSSAHPLHLPMILLHCHIYPLIQLCSLAVNFSVKLACLAIPLSSNSFKIHFTLFSSTFANIPLLALLALQPTCFFSDSTPAHTRCRCWAALRSPLQSRRDPCPFISAFSSTFFVFSMSHLPLLRLCLSVNIASWPPFIILQTLAPRIVFLAVLSPQFSGVDMSSSSTTQSVSWTSAPDQELNQAPQVCNSHHPLSSTLSAQTLLSSPLPTLTAQDSFLFFTKAYWITGIFLGMSCVFIKCLLWATSFPALLIVLPVTAALTHHHLLLGPGILARHQINSKVWKKTNLKIIR